MRFQKSGICWRNIPVPHAPFQIPPSTSIISHLTSHIQPSTLNIQHFTFSTSLSACEISVPILRTGGAICVVDKHPAWFLCRSVASAGEIFLCRMAHSKSHLPPSTSNIQHITFHIPHSQHSSPKSTRFFPSRPAPRPNTPFSAHHCNRLTPSHLPSKPSHATFQTHHSPPRNAIFRPSIPALSRPHPLPFAPRSLSPRNPIHAQRSRHPSLTAFPPVPHFASESPKSQLPGLLFHPKSQPHISTKYLYPPPLCPIACMILWNVMGWVRNGHAHFRC